MLAADLPARIADVALVVIAAVLFLRLLKWLGHRPTVLTAARLAMPRVFHRLALAPFFEVSDARDDRDFS